MTPRNPGLRHMVSRGPSEGRATPPRTPPRTERTRTPVPRHCTGRPPAKTARGRTRGGSTAPGEKTKPGRRHRKHAEAEPMKTERNGKTNVQMPSNCRPPSLARAWKRPVGGRLPCRSTRPGPTRARLPPPPLLLSFRQVGLKPCDTRARHPAPARSWRSSRAPCRPTLDAAITARLPPRSG